MHPDRYNLTTPSPHTAPHSQVIETFEQLRCVSGISILTVIYPYPSLNENIVSRHTLSHYYSEGAPLSSVLQHSGRNDGGEDKDEVHSA